LIHFSFICLPVFLVSTGRKVFDNFFKKCLVPLILGIMAGSNRSGDLADPQASIPVGTIAAICVTSITYLTAVLFFAATVDPLLLRDK
jgi:hypothetical protein